MKKAAREAFEFIHVEVSQDCKCLFFCCELGFHGGDMGHFSSQCAIISQDAVGAPRSIALMSEFISCCGAPAAPEDPPFCNTPDERWRKESECGCLQARISYIFPFFYFKILLRHQHRSTVKSGRVRSRTPSIKRDVESCIEVSQQSQNSFC